MRKRDILQILLFPEVHLLNRLNTVKKMKHFGSRLGGQDRKKKTQVEVSVVESAFASRSPKLKVAVGFLLSALSAADLSKQEISCTPGPVGAVGYCCYGCIGLRALAILRLSDIQVTKAP